VTVQAGATGREVTLDQFFPASVRVAVGGVVTWRNHGYEPHLVVFGRPISPEDPRTFGAPTVAPGSDYRGGDAVSGLIGGRPFPADGFSLRFPAAGTYPYTCNIHPGMAGVVQVR
jgi:plastocyanin